MSAEIKPKIWEACLGYKRGINRKGRLSIDTKRLMYLLRDNDFFNTIDTLREKLGVPDLKIKDDLEKEWIVTLNYREGVNSRFLKSLTKQKQNLIEKEVYKKILCPYGLSSNFYLFIEFYLLYRYLLPAKYFNPNPMMYKWYKKFGFAKEAIRNPHTTSDINYMVAQIKWSCGILGKPNKYDKALIESIKWILKFHRNTERPLSDPYKLKEQLDLLGKKEKQSYTDIAFENLDCKPEEIKAPNKIETGKERKRIIGIIKRAEKFRDYNLKK
jgi:hypothetical protein